MARLDPTTGRLIFKPYETLGRFVLDSTDEGYQVVDLMTSGTIGSYSHRKAKAIAKFCRQYVFQWGDIDFHSFPYSLDLELSYDSVGGGDNRPWYFGKNAPAGYPRIEQAKRGWRLVYPDPKNVAQQTLATNLSLARFLRKSARTL